MRSLSEAEEWWQNALLNFQRRIGYIFQNEAYLVEALTHASFAHESGLPYFNERLEYLGDAVLELVASERLFTLCPHMNEGELSRCRSSLVCKNALLKWASEMEISGVLRVNKGLKPKNVNNHLSIYADAVEAVFGAIFLDGGYEEAMKVIRAYLSFQHACGTLKECLDSKSALQMFLQEQGKGIPEYVLVSRSGPPHDPEFHVEVCYGGVVLGQGSGSSRKDAEFAAAKDTLSKKEMDLV